MLGRRPRTVTAPSNDTEALVPVYTPDPHGAALFAGVVNGNLGHLGGRPVISRSSSETWHGWTAAPQAFKGALGVGAGRPVVPPSTRLDQTRGAQVAPDPIQSIFEERMNARRFG
jgi:hypothetical protein